MQLQTTVKVEPIKKEEACDEHCFKATSCESDQKYSPKKEKEEVADEEKVDMSEAVKEEDVKNVALLTPENKDPSEVDDVKSEVQDVKPFEDIASESTEMFAESGPQVTPIKKKVSLMMHFFFSFGSMESISLVGSSYDLRTFSRFRIEMFKTANSLGL